MAFFAVIKSSENLQYVNPEKTNSSPSFNYEGMVNHVVKNNPNAVKKLVSKTPKALEYVNPANMTLDKFKAVIKAAVKENPRSLQYINISEAMKKKPHKVQEVIREAVMENPETLQFTDYKDTDEKTYHTSLRKALRKATENVIENKPDDALQYLNDWTSIRRQPVLLEKAIKKDPKALKHITREKGIDNNTLNLYAEIAIANTKDPDFISTTLKGISLSLEGFGDDSRASWLRS